MGQNATGNAHCHSQTWPLPLPSDPMSNSLAASKIAPYFLNSALYGVSHILLFLRLLYNFIIHEKKAKLVKNVSIVQSQIIIITINTIIIFHT